MGARRVLIVAGEASSDARGAGLVRALRARGVEAEFFGVGGPALAAEGVTLLARYDRLAVVGLFEALAVVPRALRLLGELKAEIRRRPPDLFLPVDSPEINLRLARVAAERGVPVVYFVAPQVWAWRPGRVRQIARYVRELLVLFPFEVEWFRSRGVCVTYVGHPLADAAAERLARAAAGSAAPQVPPGGAGPRWRGPTAPGGPCEILLLPGSRPGEVRRHVPVMAAAADRLRRLGVSAACAAADAASGAAPGAGGAGPAAGSSGALELRLRLRMADALDERDYQPWAGDAGIALCRDDLLGLAGAADLVVAASGTASLEASLMEAPTIVIYRVSPMTWWLARRLVRVPHVAMANLAAGRAILPELLQEDCTPERLAAEMAALLGDVPRRAAIGAALAGVRRAFGPPGAYERAAERVAAHLGTR